MCNPATSFGRSNITKSFCLAVLPLFSDVVQIVQTPATLTTSVGVLATPVSSARFLLFPEQKKIPRGAVPGGSPLNTPGIGFDIGASGDHGDAHAGADAVAPLGTSRRSRRFSLSFRTSANQLEDFAAAHAGGRARTESATRRRVIANSQHSHRNHTTSSSTYSSWSWQHPRLFSSSWQEHDRPRRPLVEAVVEGWNNFRETDMSAGENASGRELLLNRDDLAEELVSNINNTGSDKVKLEGARTSGGAFLQGVDLVGTIDPQYGIGREGAGILAAVTGNANGNEADMLTAASVMKKKNARAPPPTPAEDHDLLPQEMKMNAQVEEHGLSPERGKNPNRRGDSNAAETESRDKEIENAKDTATATRVELEEAGPVTAFGSGSGHGFASAVVQEQEHSSTSTEHQSQSEQDPLPQLLDTLTLASAANLHQSDQDCEVLLQLHGDSSSSSEEVTESNPRPAPDSGSRSSSCRTGSGGRAKRTEETHVGVHTPYHSGEREPEPRIYFKQESLQCQQFPVRPARSLHIKDVRRESLQTGRNRSSKSTTCSTSSSKRVRSSRPCGSADTSPAARGFLGRSRSASCLTGRRHQVGRERQRSWARMISTPSSTGTGTGGNSTKSNSSPARGGGCEQERPGPAVQKDPVTHTTKADGHDGVAGDRADDQHGQLETCPDEADRGSQATTSAGGGEEQTAAALERAVSVSTTADSCCTSSTTPASSNGQPGYVNKRVRELEHRIDRLARTSSPTTGTTAVPNFFSASTTRDSRHYPPLYPNFGIVASAGGGALSASSGGGMKAPTTGGTRPASAPSSLRTLRFERNFTN